MSIDPSRKDLVRRNITYLLPRWLRSCGAKLYLGIHRNVFFKFGQLSMQRSGHGHWCQLVFGRFNWWGDARTGKTIHWFYQRRVKPIERASCGKS